MQDFLTAFANTELFLLPVICAIGAAIWWLMRQFGPVAAFSVTNLRTWPFALVMTEMVIFAICFGLVDNLSQAWWSGGLAGLASVILSSIVASAYARQLR